MDGMTVVLGWDALDYELVEAFELGEAFGTFRTRLDTFDNPHLEKPHTYEVWPAIITGLPPEDHGIFIDSEDGVDWRNPVFSAISEFAAGRVPRWMRASFGRQLQNRGLELDFKSAAYFGDHDIHTLFDGRTARPIAIPNYRVPADDELDIVFDRGAQLKRFLSVKTAGNGKARSTPTASLSRLEERLAAEAAGKLGVVHSAIQREYDLVFVWLGFLDTIGHVAPVAAETDPSWQERAYRMAANWTAELRRALREEDRLICVSDHGLREGDHTHDAVLGTDDERLLDGAETVLDVYDVIDSVTGTHSIDTEPQIREGYRIDGSVQARTTEDIETQLSNLGYL